MMYYAALLTDDDDGESTQHEIRIKTKNSDIFTNDKSEIIGDETVRSAQPYS